jgi:hypothetical protein
MVTWLRSGQRGQHALRLVLADRLDLHPEVTHRRFQLAL